MIFRPEDPIDNNVLELARRFRKLVKKNLSARWHADKNLWVLTCEGYLSERCSISYSWIEKKKYESYVTWPGAYQVSSVEEIEVAIETGQACIGKFDTPKSAVESIALYKFMEEGVSTKVISFLAEKLKFMELSKAVNEAARDSEVMVSSEEMKILGIDNNLRGAVSSKRFGV